MSNYFQTLNRIERERSASRAVEAPVFEDIDEFDGIDESQEPASAAAVVANGRQTEARPQAGQATASAPAVVGTHKAAAKVRFKKKAAPQAAVLDRVHEQEVSAAEVARPATPAPARKIRKQSLLDANSASGDGQLPYVTLFDNLRARTDQGSVRTLVLAGASSGDRADQVATGLATLARRRGLSVLLADIEEGVKQPLLRARNAALRDAIPGNGRRHAAAAKAASQNARYASPVALDLRGGSVAGELGDWLESATTSHDMVIVEAPALGRSVDAALLARNCDGLIIVVDSATTTKDSLRIAVERAQASGCRVLGLVMTGTRRVVPDWMTRMTGSAQSN